MAHVQLHGTGRRSRGSASPRDRPRPRVHGLDEPLVRDRAHLADVLEDPQILFAVMIVGAYAISRQQHDAYRRYRESYPAAYRLAVHKAKWLHRLGALAIGLLILAYFVPTATWILGIRVFVSGLAYWVLAIAFAV